MWTWVANNSGAIEAVAAILSMLAILCGAVTFICVQLLSLAASRRERHQYVMDLYREFLAAAMNYPRLRLGYGVPAKDSDLTSDELHQRDIGFDMLTSMLELAYLTYADSIRVERSGQGGIVTYVTTYNEQTIRTGG
jgi:hypothetical protein